LSEEELELVAKGLMRLPEKKLNVEAFLAMPREKVSGNAGTQAVIDEREEG
jgi:hypothetical protein